MRWRCRLWCCAISWSLFSPLAITEEALVELAELREPVDAFFEKVMVNVDDKDLRINRLSMLEKLRELFLRVADISLLQ